MAIETTSTFTVTVKHRGAKKSFDELFRTKALVKSKTTVIINTSTEKLPPVSKYSDEQKIARMLIKQACEAANLKPGTGQNLGTYKLQYTYHTRKSGKTVFHVGTCFNDFVFQFPNGVGSEGNIQKWPAGTFEVFNAEPKESMLINLANPDFGEKVTAFLLGWYFS